MRLVDENDPSINIEETLAPAAIIFNDELNTSIVFEEFQNFVKKIYKDRFDVQNNPIKLSKNFLLICDIIQKSICLSITPK